MFQPLSGYISRAVAVWVNLPGTGDTVIKQAVPSGGDSGLALCRVEACELLKRGRLGCTIFGRGGLRSRVPRTLKANTIPVCKVLVYLSYTGGQVMRH